MPSGCYVIQQKMLHQFNAKTLYSNHFYVDYLLGDGDTQEQVIDLFKDIRTTLEAIGMPIRKFASRKATDMRL